jgi:hypothetical protein
LRCGSSVVAEEPVVRYIDECECVDEDSSS